ncbi:hypothetical protein DENSPDRAFT_689726 [Dentipellis sp. KUC8613]|nr:hypothetical protein DENSPDRAFT_689726 [Dentipellis sp. KUC8613]
MARSISTSCPASNSTTPCCRASVLVSWYTSSVATSTAHPSRFLQHTDGARLVTLGAGSGCGILHAQVNRKARKPKPHASFVCFLMRFHPCQVLRIVVRSSSMHHGYTWTLTIPTNIIIFAACSIKKSIHTCVWSEETGDLAEG